jgi:hypothetical protein
MHQCIAARVQLLEHIMAHAILYRSLHLLGEPRANHNNGLYYRWQQMEPEQTYGDDSSVYTEHGNEHAHVMDTVGADEPKCNNWQQQQQQQSSVADFNMSSMQRYLEQLKVAPATGGFKVYVIATNLTANNIL